MTLPVAIQGHGHPNARLTNVRVTTAGQLVTGNLAFDLTSFVELAVDDQVYNFYTPRAGRQFVISGIIATANKSVAANAEAAVEIYEGSSTSDATVDRALITFVLTQSTVRDGDTTSRQTFLISDESKVESICLASATMESHETGGGFTVIPFVAP